MEYKIAKESDIEAILSLHEKYHVDTVTDEDKADGFITTQFNYELLKELINIENGLFIAVDQRKVVAYVMAASWEYCSKWPIFKYMIEKLHEVEFLGEKLSTSNSYQYGPICIDKKYRGSGVLEKIFDLARNEMNKRFPILVTFVNKQNPRSIRAHVEKLGLSVAMEFEYNNNVYMELVYDTSKPIE